MNKEKVNKLIDSIDSGLNDIEEDQQPVMQALTEYVRADVRDLKEELNSKPVMPKVFDIWHKLRLEDCSCKEDEIDALVETYTNKFTAEGEIGLRKWINGDWTESPDRFTKCIDAIRYGYEVEK